MSLLYTIEEFAEFVCGYGTMAYFIFNSLPISAKVCE